MLKETGYSSGFFVNQLRKRMSFCRGVKRFKLGHAGTLDPFADGVLVLLGGRAATRAQTDFMAMPKSYTATVVFGATTSSLDPETEVVEEDPNFQVDEAALQRVIPSFVGEIMQVPPLFSAKKVDGKRAYKLARKGSEHELDAVPVVLEKLALLSCEDREARIEMTCGSGFYVRSLARDLAAALGTVGYLKDLRRTECGGFKLDECVKLRDALDAAQPIAR